MKQSSCFKTIDEWRAALTRLPDQNFFELLRSVFGNIKTPFNKQKLMDNVVSFLSKEDIRSNIAAYIDEKDHLIIAAVVLLGFPAPVDMEKFFAGDLSFGELHALLRNMEERFILYRFDDSESRRLALNPVLESILAPYISNTALLFPSVPSEGSTSQAVFSSQVFTADSRILTALFSFIKGEEFFFKTEGGLRKKVQDEGKTMFPDLDIEFVSGILEKLGLFHTKGDTFIPDEQRIDGFSSLSPLERQEYWAAALYLKLDENRGAKIQAWENTGYSLLREKVSVIHSFMCLLNPKRRYPMTTLRRFAYLLVREDVGNDQWGRSLFGDSAKFNIEIFFEALEKCGLLCADGDFHKTDALTSSGEKNEKGNAVIAMDSAFGFALYPDITLADAVTLASFCSVNSGKSFELSRASAIRGFDKGLSSGEIIAFLKRLSGGKIDSNLEWTLKDWESRYTSVSLYSGEILILAKDRRYLADAPPLSYLIKKELVPGVYLLNTESRNEITKALLKAGVDIFSQPEGGAEDNYGSNYSGGTFTALKKNLSSLSSFIGTPVKTSPAKQKTETKVSETKVSKGKDSKGSVNAQAALKKRFSEHLKKTNHTEAEREELNARIERRLVLTETQLEVDSFKYEKLEARGLDFAGKNVLARQAVSTGSLIEVSWQDAEGNVLTVLGIPSALEKKENENILVIKSDKAGGGDIRLPIRKISRLRRIKQSIFE
ncbi:MAG: helicase-associated domain-containing protein [Treponema sp.]|jgi:hypothetical protein|nr:helicase-associated domain-containing protein [Treponema sp.]